MPFSKFQMPIEAPGEGRGRSPHGGYRFYPGRTFPLVYSGRIKLTRRNRFGAIGILRSGHGMTMGANSTILCIHLGDVIGKLPSRQKNRYPAASNILERPENLFNPFG
jgi:hypothetical protein